MKRHWSSMYVTIIESCRGSVSISKKVRKGCTARVPASETVQAEGRRGSDSGITKVESGECLPKKLKALALEEERQDKRRK